MSRSILPLSSPSKYFLWMDEKRRWNLPGGQYRRVEREDGLTEVKPIRTRTVQSSRFRESSANASTNFIRNLSGNLPPFSSNRRARHLTIPLFRDLRASSRESR